MEWDLPEILSAIKRLGYQTVHSFDRLLLFNSLAQNATFNVLRRHQQNQVYLFTVEQLAAKNCFDLLRSEIVNHKAEAGENQKSAFYQLRRQLIETLEPFQKFMLEPSSSAGIEPSFISMETVNSIAYQCSPQEMQLQVGA